MLNKRTGAESDRALLCGDECSAVWDFVQEDAVEPLSKYLKNIREALGR